MKKKIVSSPPSLKYRDDYKAFTMVILGFLLYIIRYNRFTKYIFDYIHSSDDNIDDNEEHNICIRNKTESYLYWVDDNNKERLREEYIKKNIINTTNCSCFQCTGNRTNNRLDHERLRDYILHLINGYGSKIEKYIWSYYYIHKNENDIHFIHHDNDINRHLKDSITTFLINVYNYRYTIPLFIISVSYIILILSSHYWIIHIIPIYNDTNNHIKSTSLVLHNHTTQYDYKSTIINECDTESLEQSSYCITKSLYLWKPMKFIKEYNEIGDDNKDDNLLQSLVDENNHVSIILNRHYHSIKTRYILPLNILLDYLTKLRNKYNIECICPKFIGIYDNITFIYNNDENRWLLMYKPYIYKHSILSKKIISMIEYNTKEDIDKEDDEYYHIYYENYNKIKKITPNNHYDLLYVDFISLNRLNDSIVINHQQREILKDENTKLRNHDIIDKCIHNEDDKDRRLIFLSNYHYYNYDVLHDKRMLKRDESICFTFCQSI